jgi:hypothetical protein
MTATRALRASELLKELKRSFGFELERLALAATAPLGKA